MIRRFIIVVTLAASCAAPMTGHAQTRAGIQPTTNAALQQLDQAKRAWLGQAVSHILGDEADQSGAR